MFFKKKKKEVISKEEIQKQNREKTANEWIPIADIENCIVYRKDDLLVGALRIQPTNIDLLSDREQRRIISALSEELNGETEGFEIFCIGRPVDLNYYLEWLQEKAKMEQDFTRKQVLKGYIQQASYIASTGKITERRFYIIITKKNGKKAEMELIERLKDLSKKLDSAELKAHICNDDELIDLFSLFANPIQAAYERTKIEYELPSVLI